MQCPICYSSLEVREVAPCMECGGLPEEIEHAFAGLHTYAEMQIFGELRLVLCDFCYIDFGSFDPEFFGLPKNSRIGPDHMDFVRAINEITITRDKYCPQCGYRLAFLKFLEQARILNGNRKSDE